MRGNLAAYTDAVRKTVVVDGRNTGFARLTCPAKLEDAQAQVVVPVPRRAEVAVGRPAAPGGDEPATAAKHAVRARCRSRRIVHRRLRIVTAIIPILAPLPHVPVHVIQPPGVRLLLAHRMRLAARVLVIPGVFAQLRLVVPKAIPRLAPRPAGIFPLRLAGQAGTCLRPASH